MRGAFAVYAVAALVLAAGSGPAVQALRDATLEDLAELKRPRPLDHFPFIETFKDHLPPVVVDWIVIDPSMDVKVPDGAKVLFDDQGRLIIVWPEGCSEEVNDPDDPRREDCPDPAEPPPPEPVTCPGDPEWDNNTTTVPSDCPEPDLKCASGYEVAWDPEFGDYVCRLDPACEAEPVEDRPSYCPAPPPPPPRCPEDHVESDDDTDCVPLAEHELLSRLVSDEGQSAPSFPLKVAYQELRLEIDVRGQPSPGYTVSLERVSDGTTICLVSDSNGNKPCTIQGQGPFGSGTYTYRTDPADAPFPTGAYRLRIDYTEPTVASGQPDSIRLVVRGTVVQ